MPCPPDPKERWGSREVSPLGWLLGRALPMRNKRGGSGNLGTVQLRAASPGAKGMRGSGKKGRTGEETERQKPLPSLPSPPPPALAQARSGRSLTACFGSPRGPLLLGAAPSPRPAQPPTGGIDYSPQHAARRAAAAIAAWGLARALAGAVVSAARAG